MHLLHRKKQQTLERLARWLGNELDHRWVLSLMLSCSMFQLLLRKVFVEKLSVLRYVGLLNREAKKLC